MSSKLNDDRVPAKQSDFEVNLNLNQEAIMTSLTAMAKSLEKLHGQIDEIKKLAKAGKF